MTAPKWPHKRLIGGDERTRLWSEDTADLAARRARREQAGMAYPPVTIPPADELGDDEPDERPDVLAVACAWVCLAVSALIIGSALLRWAWVVVFG